MKIANRNARQYVVMQHPFQGSNLYAEFFCVDPKDPTGGQNGYVVYSYGEHHPLLIAVHIDGQDHWFANEDNPSRTTAKHRTQCRPDIYQDNIDLHWLSTQWMKLLVRGGYRALVKARVIEGVAA
jgi:hypothetical protein